MEKPYMFCCLFGCCYPYYQMGALLFKLVLLRGCHYRWEDFLTLLHWSISSYTFVER